MSKIFKSNCFAYRNGECVATKYKTCRECNFFKTTEQNEQECEITSERAKSKGYYNDTKFYEPIN